MIEKQHIVLGPIWTNPYTVLSFFFFFWLFRQSLVSAAVGVYCTDVKGKRFSGWIRSERGRFCPKRQSCLTFSLSIESVLTSMDGRGNGRLSGIVLLLLSSFHQLVHVLGYFIIGYFGISLCRFNTRVSHHLLILSIGTPAESIKVPNECLLAW